MRAPIRRHRLISPMAAVVLAAGAVACAARPVQGADADSADLVVLVHGMGRTSVSMLPMEISLERSGYRVLNFNYSSYGPSIAEIAGHLADSLEEELGAFPARRVHFVGHSLGNIVITRLLANEAIPVGVGRVAMLAPPNRGSRVADRLAPTLSWLLPPITELTTAHRSAAGLRPPDGVEFAIIAGDADGKVAVAETCLPGAAAHVAVPSGHTFIMIRPSVIEMVREFLASGAISDAAATPVDCSDPIA
jgi:pimeloyl-ACP methyl ester carboxylesterase